MSNAGRTCTVTVCNEKGIHTRTATAIARTIKEFQSNVIISNGEADADARSVIELLTLGAKKGTELTLFAKGPDFEKALESLSSLIGDGFLGVEE